MLGALPCTRPNTGRYAKAIIWLSFKPSETLTTSSVNPADLAQEKSGMIQTSQQAEDQAFNAPAGGTMSVAPLSTSRQPTMPSSGGLLGHSFTYRTADKTDVRLTWERAKAVLPATPHITRLQAKR